MDTETEISNQKSQGWLSLYDNHLPRGKKEWSLLYYVINLLSASPVICHSFRVIMRFCKHTAERKVLTEPPFHLGPKRRAKHPRFPFPCRKIFGHSHQHLLCLKAGPERMSRTVNTVRLCQLIQVCCGFIPQWRWVLHGSCHL